MIRLRRRSLAGDRRGVTAVEFGLIAFPFCLAILASFDLGYRMYVTSVVQGVLFKAARKSTVGDQTGAQIDSFVRTQLWDFSKNATITIYKAKYASFSGVGKPEKITSDTAPIGTYNTGDCYEDANGNGHYDTDQGTTGIGGSDDIIYYKVTISYPQLLPISGMLGWSNTESVSANTVLRNQPYGATTNASPPVLCS